MKIVVLAPAYVPAHKAGGPVPGIVGAVRQLDGHEVHVLTADRDLGESTPYPAPHVGTTEVDGTPVTYLPPIGWSTRRAWRSALRSLRSADAIYVNSMMSKGFTVLPLVYLFATRWRGQLMVSPRGELAATAMTLGGSRQKQLWTGLVRAVGAARSFGGRSTAWVVSSPREKDDVERVFPGAWTTVVPETLRPVATSDANRGPRSEQLRIVTVGRVARIKGIDDLVRGLADVARPVRLDVLGLLEDQSYVSVVRSIVTQLPANVEVRLVGAVEPAVVEQTLRSSHLFALLTHGENFGHAIGEALRAGCPVLISDQTPWSGVAQARAGVVLTRDECTTPRAVGHAVRAFTDMSEDEWAEWSARATEFAARSAGSRSLAEVLDVTQ